MGVFRHAGAKDGKDTVVEREGVVIVLVVGPIVAG